MNNGEITLIKNTCYVVGFDGSGHCLIKNGEVAFQNDRVIFVGKGFDGTADNIIDARNGLVIPGLINLHCHLSASPIEKGFFEDLSSPNFYMSGLYEYLHLSDMTAEEHLKVIEYSIIEVLKSGATTVFELGSGDGRAVNLIGDSGIRAYIGTMSRCASFGTDDGKKVTYRWDEAAAYDRLQDAVKLWEEYNGTYDRRISIALYPGQSDTCTPGFLKEVARTARSTGMVVQIHAAQSIIEFQKIVERHNSTPAEYLADNGISGPGTILGHYIFPSGHSMNRLQVGNELKAIADAGTSIAHCPWVFGRRGMVMESFRGYLDKGINVAIGTDTCPQDMISEMQYTAVFCKIAESNGLKGTAAEVFNAATLNAAKALGRDDIGRLCKGSKADIVIVGTDNMEMCPLRDPIKNLVYNGRSRNIDRVIVDGKTLVENGQVIGMDEERVRHTIQKISEAKWNSVQRNDWAGRDHLEISPMSFRVVQ